MKLYAMKEFSTLKPWYVMLGDNDKLKVIQLINAQYAQGNMKPLRLLP